MSRDRRQFGRKVVHVHGWIKVAGRPPVACVVRDVSLNGARIELPKKTWLPYDFLLVVEPMGLRTKCAVRYVHDRFIGVLFVREEALAEEVPAPPATSAVNIVQEWRGAAAQREPRNLMRALRSAF